MLSPYVLMNRIVEKNNIMPAGSEIRGKRPHSAQKSRGSTDQWTGARNTTYAVMAAYLRGVLVAISIPIFTGQLEKAREATDAANIRAAYAAVSTDVLLDPQANDEANEITYDTSKKTYTAEVTAVQTEDGWQTTSLKDGKIGGQTVAAQTKGKSWTITGDVTSGKVTIGTK